MIKSVASLAVLTLAFALPAQAQGNATPLGLNWSSGWSCCSRPVLDQTIVIQVGNDNKARVVDTDEADSGPRAVPLGLTNGSAGCNLYRGVYLCAYR
jgi:hypothetical protein